MSWITYDINSLGIVNYTDTEPTVSSPLATYEIDYDFPDLDKLWVFAFNTSTNEIEKSTQVYIKYVDNGESYDGIIVDISATDFTSETGYSSDLVSNTFNAYQPTTLYNYNGFSISAETEANINEYETGFSTDDYSEGLTVNGGFYVINDSANPTYATGTYTFTGTPSNGDTVTIGGVVNHFVHTLTGNPRNEMLVGASAGIDDPETLAAVLNDLLNASVGSGNTEHYKYESVPVTSSWNAPNGYVDVTATVEGNDGNYIGTSTTTSNASWGSDSLTGGDNGDETILTVDENGVEVGGSYLFPKTIGSSGQLLSVPDSGSTLEWSTGENIGNSDLTIDGENRYLSVLNSYNFAINAYDSNYDGSDDSTWENKAYWEVSDTLFQFGLDGQTVPFVQTPLAKITFNASSPTNATATLYGTILTGDENYTPSDDSNYIQKHYADDVGFISKTLTEDVNINGSETYDIRFGADTDGTTGNAYRIDSFGVYGENLVTFEAGDQSGNRFSVAMLPGLNLMQLGGFDSSSSLTGLQWTAANDMSLYYQGSEYIDFTSTEIVFKEDLDIDSGYGLAFLDSSSNRQVGFGYDEAINDAFFFYLNETDTRFSDISTLANGGIGFYDTAASSNPFFQIGSDGIQTPSGLDWYLTGDDLSFYEGSSGTSTNIFTLHGDGDHSTFDPYVTLHEGFATGNGSNSQDLVVNYGKGNKVQFNDGTRSVDVFYTKSVVNVEDTFTHMETGFSEVQHDYVDLKQLNWYWGSNVDSNTRWNWYDSTGTTTLLNFDSSGNLSVNGTLTQNEGKVLSESFQYVWGEESANLSVGYVFSFGNGETGQDVGVPIQIPSGYTCEAIGMSLKVRSALSAQVNLVLNTVEQGSSYGVSLTSQTSNTNEWSSSLSISNGDILTFYCASVTGTSDGTVANVLLKFTKS